MKTKIILSLTTILFLNNACVEQVEDDFVFNKFSGYYLIQSIESSESIDLNNDGIKSNNYLNEVLADYTNSSGQSISTNYNPNFQFNLAIAFPVNSNRNSGEQVVFNFPYQVINTFIDSNNQPVSELVYYETFYYNLNYLIEPNGNVNIINNPFVNEFFGTSNFLVIQEANQDFKLNVDLRVYCFVEKAWIDTTLTVNYKWIFV